MVHVSKMSDINIASSGSPNAKFSCPTGAIHGSSPAFKNTFSFGRWRAIYLFSVSFISIQFLYYGRGILLRATNNTLQAFRSMLYILTAKVLFYFNNTKQKRVAHTFQNMEMPHRLPLVLLPVLLLTNAWIFLRITLMPLTNSSIASIASALNHQFFRFANCPAYC